MTGLGKVNWMGRSALMKALSGFERLLFLLGILLVSACAMALGYTWVSSRLELRRFWRSHLAVAAGQSGDASQRGGANPDFRLWSEKRIEAYQASLSGSLPSPLAVLKIPAIDLEVPVLEGTDDLTLNRGVGHIQGTPVPGIDGNVGIAGHRDGFFRGLKDIHQGDALDLVTNDRSDRYLVDEILIVAPEDVYTLQARPKPSITLVTCFPFYYIGSAPQRYIVHASIATTTSDNQAGPPNSLGTRSDRDSR
jgi:sortase A